MRAFSVALALFLAGCTSAAAPVVPDAEAVPMPVEAAPVDPTNQAPTAVLSADSVQGTAPLAVTFTLSGSDPDSDALHWFLDLDDDGRADAQGDDLPARHATRFGPGTHHVRLAIHDGGRATITSLDIVVEA